MYSQDASYDAKFSGNMMLVGSTRTGKTSYLQEILLNGLIPNSVKKLYWISGIYLSENRKEELKSNFPHLRTKFTHVPDSESFDKVLDNLKHLSENEEESESDSDSDETKKKLRLKMILKMKL